MQFQEEKQSESICYLNGDMIPFQGARLPVFDLAIMQGATVTERLRTFRHVPYDVDAHLKRLQQSLDLVGWPNLPDLSNLSHVVAEIARLNTKNLAVNSDLAIVLFVSAGQAVGDSNGLIDQSKPTVCVYSAPLPFSKWIAGYTQGVELIVPEVRQIPRISIDPKIKMRSRLHWQLADQEARRKNPRALALLLDEYDCLTETSSGNLMIVKNGAVYSPRESQTLDGISRQHVIQICEELEIPFTFTDLKKSDLLQADEAFLTSSTFCLMPVASVDGNSIGTSIPGTVTEKIRQSWTTSIGLDFVEQAKSAK